MGANREPVGGTLPTLYLLRSAYRVSRLLTSEYESLRGLRGAYRRLPTDGLFDVDAFRRGEQLLETAGLLEQRDGQVRLDERILVLRELQESEACRVLLALLVEAERPLWLRVAVGTDEVRDVYIPDGVLDRLEKLFATSEDRDAFLVALERVDPAAQSELGKRGEEVVVAACREQRRVAGFPRLAEAVQRVSRLSDGFGYDVSAPCAGTPAYHLEVKTVGSRGNRLTIHLSRHQVQVGRRDPRWALVVCCKRMDDVELVGWCRASQLEVYLPRDGPGGSQVEARWTNVAMTLVPNMLTSGLPPLSVDRP